MALAAGSSDKAAALSRLFKSSWPTMEGVAETEPFPSGIPSIEYDEPSCDSPVSPGGFPLDFDGIPDASSWRRQRSATSEAPDERFGVLDVPFGDDSDRGSVAGSYGDPSWFSYRSSGDRVSEFLQPPSGTPTRRSVESLTASASASLSGSSLGLFGDRPIVGRRMSADMTSHDFSWSAYAPQLLDLTETPARTPLLQRMTRNGIPNALRPQLWPILSGSKFAMAERPGYYADLIAHPENASLAVMRQIDTDLHRTFPERLENASAHYKKGRPPGQARMRRVLMAYSMHNRAVGYCQGMNFVASFLLSVFDSDEEAFWMLVVVIERLLPANYYDASLKGIRAEADLFKMIVEKEMPQLSRHLDTQGIDMGMFTLDWFVSLFTLNFRPKITLRVWDVFLFEGRVLLFCAAHSLVRLHEARLRDIHSMDKLYAAVKRISQAEYNPDDIVKSINILAMSQTVKRLAFGLSHSQQFPDPPAAPIGMFSSGKSGKSLGNTSGNTGNTSGLTSFTTTFPSSSTSTSTSTTTSSSRATRSSMSAASKSNFLRTSSSSSSSTSPTGYTSARRVSEPDVKSLADAASDAADSAKKAAEPPRNWLRRIEAMFSPSASAASGVSSGDEKGADAVLAGRTSRSTSVPRSMAPGAQQRSYRSNAYRSTTGTKYFD